ncbi:hypothetical protein [Algivirga pacifica]|uniref:Uncharacterized protein n=1 Tax=Algivirga pacifica TaxID=1162670 RepID=A0ABP9DLZ2_9BACT
MDKYHITASHQSITFPKVESIYDSEFDDDDTVFVFLKDDIYYYQQGVEYLLGRWYYEKDTLFFTKLCDYRTQNYQILVKKMSVGEGFMHQAELNYNVLNEINHDNRDTIYQLISTETFNPSLYFNLDYSIVDISMMKGILNVKTSISNSKHSSTEYFDISWCNQLSNHTCDCVFLLDEKKDNCK